MHTKQPHLFLLLSVLLTLAVSLLSCKQETVSSDPNLRLRFSADSVCFDTVFNQIGSSTQLVMVYNPNRNALKISNITLQGDYFRINLDGENDLNRLHDVVIDGGDSLYLFVRAYIDASTPVFVTDTIRFFVNGNEQDIALEAYGLKVHVIRSAARRTDYESQTFLADSSYLIFDTVFVKGLTRMEAGTSLYMHGGSNLLLQGGLQALGTPDKPVRIMGDRLDKLFSHVPYRVASGQWGGIYLSQPKEQPLHRDSLNYVEILSGNIGLLSQSEDISLRSHLSLSNSRIHNHALYGLVLQNVDADIWNNEFSNCASYCLYLEGGNHALTHNTIASFFGWPNSDLNIHNVGRQDVAAVYINNLDKNMAPTAVSMHNCIVTGIRPNNLVVASPLPDYYDGEFVGNYLRADSLPAAFSHDNCYAGENDNVFRNVYYRYKEYNYYDFRLDSLSPARGIGDSLWVRAPWDMDRNGLSRQNKRPDAGCYEFQPAAK